MKTLYSFLLVCGLLAILSLCDGCCKTPPSVPTGVEVSPNKLILQFPEGMSDAEKAALRKEISATKDSTCSCGNNPIELWEIDTTKIEIEEAKRKTASSGGEGGVKGDHQFYFSISDPGSRIPSTDIILVDGIEHTTSNILELTTGVTNGTGKRVNIAVVDTGLDFSDEIRTQKFLYDTSNTEMDCNGEYEHISGWNFVDNDGDISDGHSDGHGTFVTTTLMDELGRLEIPYSILPVKAFGANGRGSYWNIICALNYIKEIQGVNGDLHIVNASFGYGLPVIEEANYQKSVDDYNEKSILASLIVDLQNSTIIVASAGNNNQNTDVPGNAHFPSGFTAPNLIGVGGYTLHKTTLTNISRNIKGNFGPISIDLAAPYQVGFPGFSSNGQAEDILVKSGTSYGTPFTAAALARFLNEGSDNQLPLQLKDAFLNSLDIQQSFMGKINGGRYIDTENPVIIDPRPTMVNDAGANKIGN